MMKSIFYTLIAVILSCLMACEDSFDFVSKDNQPPSVYFFDSKSTVTMTDSLKTGTTIKTGKQYYSLTVDANDLENKLASVNFKIDAGSIKVFSGSDDITSTNTVTLNNGSVNLNLIPQVGLNSISFSATDNIGKSAVATFNIFAFDNLSPIVSVKFVFSKETGPYEYTFDASASYDKDKNFGGSITQYEYVINDNYTIKTDKKIIKYNFSGPGGYRVKYRVYDNEGATSDWLTQQITI